MITVESRESKSETTKENLPDLDIPYELLSKAQKENLPQSFTIKELMPEISPEKLEKYNAYQTKLKEAGKDQNKIEILVGENMDMIELQKILIGKMFDRADTDLKKFREVRDRLIVIS